MSCVNDNNVLTTCSECNSGVPCLVYSSITTCSAVSGGKCGVQASSGCQYQCFPGTVAGTSWMFTYKTTPSSADVGGFGPISKIKNYTLPNTVKTMTLSGGPGATASVQTNKVIEFSDSDFLSNGLLTTVAIDGISLANSAPKIPTYVSQITLSGCFLKSIPDFVLTKSLTYLSLANNTISSLPQIGTTLYSGLANLESLDLSHNSLTSFDLPLNNLVALDLTSNSFSSIPTTIFSMKKLVSLKISDNLITSAVTSDQFTFLSNLNILSMPSISGSCPSGSGIKTTSSTGINICVVGATSSSSSTGLIVGIVVGVVVLIALIGGFFWYRRRKSATEQPESNFTEFDPSYPLPGSRRRTDVDRGSLATDPSKPRGSTGRRTTTGGHLGVGSSPVYKDLLIQTKSNPDTKTHSSLALETALNPAIPVLDEDEMVYTRTLGKGAKGIVWLASYAGDVVAVKKMAKTITEADREDSLSNLVAESNLLFTLRHPHIIQLIGVVTDLMHEVAVVLEYMDLGDLRDILIKKSASPSFDWSNMKGTYALHVAQGLAYLHSKSPPLIHRDIKARNVLVDSRKGAKICDFGESRLRSYQETMTSNVGTARWIAPEVLLNDDYSEKADIYSFGVLLSELDTHSIPYSDVNLDERIIVQRVAVGQLRPKFSADCPEKLRRLANHCMQADPALRPDASKVVSSLTELLESFVQH